MTNRIGIATGLMAALFAASCGRNLTASRAAALAQKWVDANYPPGVGGGQEVASLAPIADQLGVPTPVRPAGRFPQLIEQGYILEQKVTVAYPNFSGTFTGGHRMNIMGEEWFDDTFNLNVDGAAAPPSITGTFRTCWKSSCTEGTVHGTVARSGPTRLVLAYRARENPLSDRMVNLANHADVELARGVSGEPDALTGSYTTPSTSPFIRTQTNSLRATGAAGPDIAKEAYVYRWGPKLPQGAIIGQMMKLGRLRVQSCDRLMLKGNETTASAHCIANVEMTPAGLAIYGGDPGPQRLDVAFNKQPDGGWLVTSLSHPILVVP